MFGLSSLFSYVGGVDILQKAVVRHAYLNVAQRGGRRDKFSQINALIIHPQKMQIAVVILFLFLHM